MSLRTDRKLTGVLVQKQQPGTERIENEGDGRQFPQGKIARRSAADQWFVVRNRRQLEVSGYSHLLWAGLGDEHRLHPEEDAAENVLPPAAEEVWPTASDPDTVLQGRHGKRAVLLASSLVWQHHPGPEEMSEPCRQQCGRIVGR